MDKYIITKQHEGHLQIPKFPQDLDHIPVILNDELPETEAYALAMDMLQGDASTRVLILGESHHEASAMSCRDKIVASLDVFSAVFYTVTEVQHEWTSSVNGLDKLQVLWNRRGAAVLLSCSSIPSSLPGFEAPRSRSGGRGKRQGRGGRGNNIRGGRTGHKFCTHNQQSTSRYQDSPNQRQRSGQHEKMPCQDTAINTSDAPNNSMRTETSQTNDRKQQVHQKRGRGSRNSSEYSLPRVNDTKRSEHKPHLNGSSHANGNNTPAREGDRLVNGASNFKTDDINSASKSTKDSSKNIKTPESKSKSRHVPEINLCDYIPLKNGCDNKKNGNFKTGNNPRNDPNVKSRKGRGGSQNRNSATNNNGATSLQFPENRMSLGVLNTNGDSTKHQGNPDEIASFVTREENGVEEPSRLGSSSNTNCEVVSSSSSKNCALVSRSQNSNCELVSSSNNKNCELDTGISRLSLSSSPGTANGVGQFKLEKPSPEKWSPRALDPPRDYEYYNKKKARLQNRKVSFQLPEKSGAV